MSCEEHLSVIDEHEGTEVCFNCGLVLSNCLYKEKSYEKNYSETSCFLEFLFRLNAPLNLANECDHFFQSNFFKRDKIGLTLYIILLKNNIPRTLKEISSVVGSNTNELWKAISQYQESTGKILNINPSDITERACKHLGLMFKDSEVIKKKVLHTYANFPSHHPSSIVGVNIYTYCKENKKRIQIKEIASVLGIAQISITRLFKKQNEI